MLTNVPSENSNLNNPVLTTILFAVLVKRLGGIVQITQADIDEVAYNRLDEDANEQRIEFTYIEKLKHS